MEVLGSDGEHIGTVDKVQDDRIILTKSDPNAGGIHHSIPAAGSKASMSRDVNKTPRREKGLEGRGVQNRAYSNARTREARAPHILKPQLLGHLQRPR
jgi:hypothetical protein